MSPIKFGTDGWRGVIAEAFTFDNLRIVSQATADYVMKAGGPGQSVMVGYDRRFMSEDFALVVARQMAHNGFNVLLSESACPSPATSFMTFQQKAGIGVMITASHNPPRYNGFKLKTVHGGSTTPEITDPIESAAQQMVSAPVPDPSNLKGKITVVDFKKPYMDDIVSKVDVDLIRKVQGTVLVDVMHGSGAGYLTPLLQEWGLDAREVRGERNTWFGGVNPEPVPQNLIPAQYAVKSTGAKVVIISDGDADRIAAMDEDGRFVNPHEVFALMLMHLVESKGLRGPVAQTVSSTRMVTALANKYGLPVTRTPVGFKWVADLFMSDPNMLIGGEESGGIGVRGHIPERDSQLNGLILLEMIGERGKSLKRLVEEDLWGTVGFHCYDRRDLHLTEDVIGEVRARVKAVEPTSLAGIPVAEIDRMDGTRFNFEDGSWLLVRPSGTEPVVRVYSESTSCDKVQALLDEGVAMCR